ncbi:hypothetical protein E3N88_29216 [Mikania micrantha]|uniref:Uncharacterized protein n=1 Tax=Mikania micrantha TaxID=192012 RepID=A0A5N6MIL8_9ASTR|nr:hypothetical protein E3N88_29216 [Mikania micrantha]
MVNTRNSDGHNTSTSGDPVATQLEAIAAKLDAMERNHPKPPLRISDAEKQNRYLKGECFRCGVKYGPGHRCKTGTLKLYEIEEEQEVPLEEETWGDTDDKPEVAEISLNAILGNSQPTTMKV